MSRIALEEALAVPASVPSYGVTLICAFDISVEDAASVAASQTIVTVLAPDELVYMCQPCPT